MSYHRYLLIPILLLAGLPLMGSAQHVDGIIPGTLSVKFTDASADMLSISDEGAFVTTGFASVDQLNEQFGVTGMERIFRPAGRFEERHRAFGLHRWYRLTIPQHVSVQAAVDAYRADPKIEVAEPVYEKAFIDGYEPDIEPQVTDMLPRTACPGACRGEAKRSPEAGASNDPFFSLQWHYHNTGQEDGTPDADIDLPEAHNVETGDPSVVVSIHDDGILTDHDDLAANMWINEGEIPDNDVDDDDNGYVDDVHGYDFADDQGTIIPGHHGTHVGGTIAAVTHNGIGVAGVAGGDGTPGSGVRIMSAQVFGNSGGEGFPESYTYAADMGAVISQNSWGYTNPGVFEQVVLDAIDYYIETGGGPDAAMEGGLVIFAAGNVDSDDEWYPGYYEPTVAVASTANTDEKSWFSNFGEWVDLSAPGGTTEGPQYGRKDILSTILGDLYGWWIGTSFACPHVSGVAALVVSQNLGATDEEVRTILELSVDDIDDVNPDYEGLLGTGRINAALAVGAEPDSTGPAAVTDLLGTPDGEWVTLTWSAPFGEGLGAQGYDVRVAAGPILTETDWENATMIPGAEDMTPQSPGETEELVVTDLDFETTYHFGVRSWDVLQNLSDLSNPEEVTTLASPVATVPIDPIEVTLPPEAQETVAYTIGNAGPATLRYTLDVTDTTEGLERTPVPKPDPSERGEAPPRKPAPAEAGDQEDDSPTGEPQLMDEGGPDAFGYRWIDSNEPDGPTYAWIDITETGTPVELGSDDHVIVDLPFDFPFYEHTYNWVTIQSKGALAFSDTTIHYTNRELPLEDDWNNLLAGYWDDLNPSPSTGGGAVYYDALDDGRFVVSWIEVPHYIDVGSFTFQIVLDPSGGILYQYQTIDGGGEYDNSATVGIENADGTDGLEVVHNAPYVEAGLAVQFTTWVSVDARTGEIAAGDEHTHSLTFDAGGREPGAYTANMTVTTNEQGESLQEYLIPITLTVEGIGTEDNDLDFEGTHRLSAIAPNPVNGVAQTTLEVAEAQDVTVELFDVRGRKVATPFEGALAARTAEEIALDGSGLAPGVYVLRISGETFSETRRLTIVR